MPVLEELLVEQLQDLLHAEKQLVKAMPRVAKAVKNAEMKQAMQKHLEETDSQVERLNQVFELLGHKAKAKPCKAMQGLIEEAQEHVAEAKGKDEFASDLALAVAQQKIEHYEIASYGSVRTIAEALGNQKVVKLLDQTLKEEEKTDKLITELSAPIIEQANAPEEEEEEEDEEEEEEE